MQKNWQTQIYQAQQEQIQQEMAFGIFFCKTGAEHEAIINAERIWPEAEFMTARIVKKRSNRKHGGDYYQEEIAIPSYVFFRAPVDFHPIGHPNNLYRILTVNNGQWQLQGGDEAFARWLFEKEGKIGLSKVYRKGEQIIIQEGPLKDLQGYITRIDKRNAKGQVELDIDGRKIRVWLCFEWVKPL